MIQPFRTCLLALVASTVCASAANAQIFYEPVQSQYGSGRDAFYYGGGDPRVIDSAAQRLRCIKDFSAVREGRFGVGYLHRGLINHPPFYVVSDCFPWLNAAAYGYTPTDARDTAYANVPRYFRKADLLRAARPADDGRSWVVPAQADPSRPGAIDIRPYVRPATVPSAGPTAAPGATPRPLLIIPKKVLEGPGKSGNSIARAG